MTVPIKVSDHDGTAHEGAVHLHKSRIHAQQFGGLLQHILYLFSLNIVDLTAGSAREQRHLLATLTQKLKMLQWLSLSPYE